MQVPGGDWPGAIGGAGPRRRSSFERQPRHSAWNQVADRTAPLRLPILSFPQRQQLKSISPFPPSIRQGLDQFVSSLHPPLCQPTDPPIRGVAHTAIYPPPPPLHVDLASGLHTISLRTFDNDPDVSRALRHCCGRQVLRRLTTDTQQSSSLVLQYCCKTTQPRHPGRSLHDPLHRLMIQSAWPGKTPSTPI